MEQLNQIYNTEFTQRLLQNKHIDFKLTNDDLANMLSIPSINQPIHKRLKMDFSKKNFDKHPDSFKQIFLEIEPESELEFDSSLELENMDSIFNNNKKLERNRY